MIDGKPEYKNGLVSNYRHSCVYKSIIKKPFSSLLFVIYLLDMSSLYFRFIFLSCQ